MKPSPLARVRLARGQQQELFAHHQDNPSLTLSELGLWTLDRFALPRAPAAWSASESLKRYRLRPALLEEEQEESPAAHVSLLLDEVLSEWIERCAQRRLCLTGRPIRLKAECLRDKIAMTGAAPTREHLLQLRFSKGWLYNFQRRLKLQSRHIHGEAGSASPAVIEYGRARLREVAGTFGPKDVFNLDETALLRQQAEQEEDHCGSDDIRRRLRKAPLLFVGSARQPHCFGHQSAEQLGVEYTRSGKGWMTRALFKTWVEELNTRMKREDRHILLLLGNAPAYYISEPLSDVELSMLPPKTTSVLQPMDAGVIAALKAWFRRRQGEHAVERADAIVSTTDGGSSGSELYKADVLQVMRWCQDAWESVSQSTVANRWKHASILPEDIYELLSGFAATAAVDARRPSDSFFLNRQAQMTGSARASITSAAEATECADAQTHKQVPPLVRGPTTSDDSENDPVVGKRIRKSFGSRFFWGSVVGCYHIADAPFYKISFDDGDVDILAAAEVLQDVKQAEKYAAEDAFVPSNTPGCAQEPTAAADDTTATLDPSQQPSFASRYQDELRQATLKRKRDEQPAPEQEPESVSDTYNMKVWDQRLFLSIVTSKRVTTVAEFVRRDDGSIGEIEASGRVKIGDIISHINRVPVAGMDSGAVSDRIKASRRPMEITFRRPRPRASISFSGTTTGAIPRDKSQDRRPLEADAVRVTDLRTGAEAVEHTAAVPSAAINHTQASAPEPASSNHPVVAPSTYRTQHPVTASSTPISESQPSPDVASTTTAPPQYPEQQLQTQHDLAPRSNIPQHASAPAYSSSINSNLHFVQQQPERQPSPLQQQQYQLQDPTQQFANAPAFNNSTNRFIHQPANQSSMQQYPARPHPQAAQQEHATSSHSSFSTSTPFDQQPRRAMPTASAHAWNNPYRSGQPVRRVGVSFYGMQITPQPQPSTNSYNLSYGANHAPSYPRQQHLSPQASAGADADAGAGAGAGAGSQQFAGSHHPTAMVTQYSQQVPTWWQSGNGNQIVARNFPVSSSGSNSFMAPSARTTPEFNHRSGADMLAQIPTQQPPAVQNGPYAGPSSQQSGLESEHRYDSAVRPPNRSVSENESRFSVIEPAQDESDTQQEDRQQQYRSEAVDDSGTESDEARGAFVLEDDLDDGERELASALGTDMTPFTDSPAAAEAPSLAEETSFLSPNKPSFVSKLPENLGNRYRQLSSSQHQHQQHQQQLFTAGMTPSISDEECAIVRIRRSRLYVTLGSLGSRVSITSFVRGKEGEVGEIEQSGKVLLGDTIVAINGVPVPANTTPTEVARVVISLPRPFELYFQRASWDVLDGQE